MSQAPPAGTIFVAAFYRWGALRDAVTVLFGGASESFAELKAQTRTLAKTLVVSGAGRGDRCIISLHAIHPAEGVPCHLGEEFTVRMPMTVDELRVAVSSGLGTFLRTLENTAPGAQGHTGGAVH